jgi:hypothetical protein
VGYNLHVILSLKLQVYMLEISALMETPRE